MEKDVDVSTGAMQMF